MKSALAEALQSGDFKNLNDLVSQTVTDAVNEVGKHVSFINNGNPQNRQNKPGEPSNASFNSQQQAQRQQAQSQQAQNSMPVWQQRARERELKKQQEWQGRE
jgi:catabolite regulation protein CreA